MLKLYILVLFIVVSVVKCQINCNQPPAIQVAPNSCCDMPEKNKEMIDSCFSEFRKTRKLSPHSEGGEPLHEPGSCIAECILNKTNIIRDGKIDRAAAQDYIQTNHLTTPDWEPVLNEILDVCVDKANNEMSAEMIDKEAKCKPMSGIFIGCLHGQTIIKCPAAKWTDSADCNTLKQYITTCRSFGKN